MKSQEWRKEFREKTLKESNQEKIRDYFIKQVMEMPNGTIISQEDLKNRLSQDYPELNKDISAIKIGIRGCMRMLEGRGIARMLPNGNCIKDEKEDIKQEEEALKIRDEALEVANHIVEELKAKGEQITKDTILEKLAEDVKNNEQYKTWIVILCSQGAISELEEQKQEER